MVGNAAARVPASVGVAVEAGTFFCPMINNAIPIKTASATRPPITNGSAFRLDVFAGGTVVVSDVEGGVTFVGGGAEERTGSPPPITARLNACTSSPAD